MLIHVTTGKSLKGDVKNEVSQHHQKDHPLKAAKIMGDKVDDDVENNISDVDDNGGHVDDNSNNDQHEVNSDASNDSDIVAPGRFVRRLPAMTYGSVTT